jgi:putative Mg2+ transporter-C (MgtC) family protein
VLMALVPLAQGVFLQRLALATALGLAIGLERQWRQRTASLHTVALVAVGAALFAALPELLGSTDALRVAAQVVSGVGFLAGGVILRDGFNVRGLTTAATLWATAAVGVLAGSGLAIEALAGSGVILAVNVFCFPLAGIISRIPRASGEHLQTTYTLHVECTWEALAAVRAYVEQEVRATSLTVSTLTTNAAPSGDAIVLAAQLTKPGREDGTGQRLRDAIAKFDGVSSASWESVETQV